MSNINPTILHNACVNGDAAAVRRLLPAGGTPRNLSGQRFQFLDAKITPLMAAASRGHTEIVRILLQRARNTIVDQLSTVGVTAQILAAQYHHVDILQVLADHGANVSLADRQGNTALILAVAKLDPNARPRDLDPDGARQLATVTALIRLGAGTWSLPRAPVHPALPDPTAQVFDDLTFHPKISVTHGWSGCGRSKTRPYSIVPRSPRRCRPQRHDRALHRLRSLPR
jgi:hypothetical protein